MMGVPSFLCVIFLTVLFQNTLSTPQFLDLPIAKIYQVQSDNRLKPWTRIDSNFETVVEHVENLRLDCQANYPIQWIYTGNGIPAFTSTNKYSRRNTQGSTSTEFTATVVINPLKEHHTGKYQCSPADFIDGKTFFYIYVPGQNVFISITGHNIILPKNDTMIVIPCTVSDPNAFVTLDKSEGDVLRKVKVRSSDAVTYDPKTGFRLRLDKIDNPEGTYVCTARQGSNIRTVEYTVKSSFNEYLSDQPSANLEKCKKRCGENAFCDVVNGKEICQCHDQFNGDPNVKCVIHCQAHTDCPKTMSCFADLQCRDTCVHSQVGCGIGAKCRVENHRPICYCPPDWLGDETIQCFNSLQGSEPAKPQSPADPSGRPRPTPPKPSGSGQKCRSNTECPPNMSCIKTTAANNVKECFDPCSTIKCGFNAECKVENRRAFCSCKSGFYGDARIECSPEKLEKEPQFEPLIQQSVDSQLNKRCTKPEVCGLHSECKVTKGGAEQCSCLEGFMGQSPKCRPECLSNSDCPGGLICLSDTRVGYPTCVKQCGSRVCGAHASCEELEDGSSECICTSDSYGDPLVKCETKEMRLSKDCAEDYDCGIKLKCEIGAEERKCVDPCDKRQCGSDMVCEAKDHKAVCVCPRGSTGNEYVGCQKNDPISANLCANLTCGYKSECLVEGGKAKCACKSGFVGKHPVCVSSCFSNSDCPVDLSCVNNRCTARCLGCGKNTKCRVAPNLNRSSVCYCLRGFEGNPYGRGCSPIPK